MLNSLHKRDDVRLSVIASVFMLALGNAQAQTQVSGTEESVGSLEEVVVTGSRVVRDGFDSPTAVSVLSEGDIAAEAPANIIDFVATLPSVQGSSTASSSSAALSSGGAGIASLNLRALGSGRTLVLFDGHRSVVSSSDGDVDINTFPQSLIERVDVVTGGASSAYGSDAVSGVVNFILDKDYTGIKTTLNFGQTTYDDVESSKFTVTAGTPFADDKGHFLFSTELFDVDGVHFDSGATPYSFLRDWAEQGFFAMVNPDDTPGAPYYLVSTGIGISNYSPGGLITDGPLRGTYFGEGGSVNQLEYGEVSGQWMLGGDWRYTTSGQIGTGSLAADEQRESAFSRASYQIGSGLEIFGEVSYASYEGRSQYLNPPDRGRTIFADNAFLPAEVARQMVELELDSFTMGTSNMDVAPSGNNNRRETTRLVVGADGEFEAAGKSWLWDIYYQRGITDTDEHQLPTFHLEHLDLASDAVFHPDTGEIVCRSTIADRDNGCVPMNRFGIGVASQEALDYVLGRPRRQQEFQQDVAAVNFSTTDFQGWAGAISFAAGAEYRKEQITGDVEEIYASGWQYGNYKVTEGEYDVMEAYAETLVPLAQTLRFNGAVRYTDYSTSGGVETWKAGLVYTPIDAFTLRVTQSRDIRAPNLSELYAAGTARTNSVGIGGEAVGFVQNLQGNPSVAPEEADTLGIGVVVRPSFAPGLQASIDYYDIEVNGVIDYLEAQDIVDYCFLFDVDSYCNNLNYVDGELSTIDIFYENLNSLKASGVDYEARYAFGIGPGELSLRLMATNYLENITDDGVNAFDSVGMNTGDTPDWVYRMTARYSTDDWMVNLTARGVSDGVFHNQYIECTSGCPESIAPHYTINENDIDGKTYLDAYVSRNFRFGGNEAEIFLSVKNLFDTDPPLIRQPSRQGSVSRPGFVPTNRGLYDVIGRNFRIGFRARF